MAATGQSLLEATQADASRLQVNRRRWVDLGIVFLIGIVPSIFNAVYELLYPTARMHGSNISFVSSAFAFEPSTRWSPLACVWQRSLRSLC